MVHIAPLTAPEPLAVAPDKVATFQRAIDALDLAGVPFALGGGLALYYYTGIRRDVHDLDIHLVPADVPNALQALDAVGFETHVHHAPWLAQAWYGDIQIDLVFGQGSWHQSVERNWIERGPTTEFLGRAVHVLPPEAFILSKAMRMSRMRYDGPDIAHLLAAEGGHLDWRYLIDSFGDDWEVLASHVILFRYVYPSRAADIPDWALAELFARLVEGIGQEWVGPPLCRGALLDTSGPFDQDSAERGYVDERDLRWQERLEREPVLRELCREERRWREMREQECGKDIAAERAVAVG